ncbi:hypothetical protein D3C79_591720 [compost metagenome]
MFMITRDMDGITCNACKDRVSRTFKISFGNMIHSTNIYVCKACLLKLNSETSKWMAAKRECIQHDTNDKHNTEGV